MDFKEFIHTDLWRTTRGDISSRWKRAGYSVMRTIIVSARGFISKRLNFRAHSLTYCLMFAIVPILAMIFAVGRGFGFTSVMEDILNRSFIGDMDLTTTVMDIVQRYLDMTKGGLFLGIGMLILLWAVYMFFRNIEISFNEIWDVKKSRAIGRQIVNYVSILFLIPLLIIVTSGLSIWITTATSSIPQFQALHAYHHHVAKILSYLFVWLVFTWLYKAVPNTHVSLKAAAIPAVIMGTLFQLLQALSVYIIVLMSRVSIIYGAFAIIPLLMMWLQWSCLLLLIGAEMSYAIQNKEEFEYEQDLNTMSRRYKDYVMLYLLSVIVHRFEADQTPLTAREIAHQEHLPIRLVSSLLSRLEQTHIVREVYVENKEERTYQPAMDPKLITVNMVFDRIDCQGSEQFLRNPSEGMQQFWERFVALKQSEESILHISVSSL